jgi:hypothetical protein
VILILRRRNRFIPAFSETTESEHPQCEIKYKKQNFL